MPELKLGYQGPLYDPFYEWMGRKYSKVAPLLGRKDGYFGSDEKRAVEQLQINLGIVVDGVFGDRTASAAGYIWPGETAPPVVEVRRPIWFYSCPGSGADFWLGPSHDVGEMVCGRGFNEPGRKSLSINHQPVKFAKGGYMGLMGGDPGLSYLDVIRDQRASLEFLLDNNPDVKRAMTKRQLDPRAPLITGIDVELWFSAYSQSADGMLEAILYLFGDGGRFSLIRDRINGLLLFGNPATEGTGIARKTWPEWLRKLTRNINTTNDFYAVAKDKIRPLFYEWFIQAETELPFVVYSAQIILPAVAKLFGDLGPLVGQFFPVLLAAKTGMTGSLSALTAITAGVNAAHTPPNPELVKLLSIQGVLTSLPDLMALLIALPGLQTHGQYHAICPPRPEFGNRVGTQYAYDMVAGFKQAA